MFKALRAHRKISVSAKFKHIRTLPHIAEIRNGKLLYEFELIGILSLIDKDTAFIFESAGTQDHAPDAVFECDLWISYVA